MSEDGDRVDKLQLHLDKASSARIYDYMLGGRGPNNYAIDRVFGDDQSGLLPNMQAAMRENRRFIGRAVETALQLGVRQFVDIGSGLPSHGQAHQVADRFAPEAKAHVVYVDNELIANAHSEILLGDEADPERHQALLADYFAYGQLWRRVLATGLIDPEQPVCLLVTALLHFMLPEDEPEIPLAYYRRKLAPGSLLVLTHALEDREDEGLQEVTRNYGHTTNPSHLRTDEEILRFFGDWELLEPGLTWTGLWRPRPDRSVEPWWEEDTRDLPPGEPWWGGDEAKMIYRGGVARNP
ncbi:polyketide biosynthesis methyltransferase [Amycolatopsis acidicola]|uniref:Polyketide biosynthesis methyltransferase n=1 Tax=Amycolatopsis acidicola TaxID=2596893 RepID=A0A5N0VLI0_9PSEU|nr:SAM-dependent methyltransferase [Amycolatopsis acidicola]KAA9165592.1 polyketide biosynthesis methyltransferase [Amycolatopsis acidicola]